MTVLGRKIEMESVLRAILTRVISAANYLDSRLGAAAYAGMTIALTFLVFVYALGIGDSTLVFASTVLASVNLLVMVYRLTDGTMEIVIPGMIMLTVACVLGISIGVANATSQSINLAVSYGIAMAAVLVPTALIMIWLRKWQAASEKRADEHFIKQEQAFIEQHRDEVLKHFSIHQDTVYPDRWLLTDLESDAEEWQESEFLAYKRAVRKLAWRANPAAQLRRLGLAGVVAALGWIGGALFIVYLFSLT